MDLAVRDDDVVVRLVSAAGDDRRGHAVVDRGSGMVRELVLDDTTWRLAELTTEPPSGPPAGPAPGGTE